MIVNTNISSLKANYFFQGNQQKVNNAIEKLSSGQRINRAADDSAGLSISTRFSTMIKSNQKALSNIGDGLSLIRTANGALSSIADQLQRLRELSLQAQNGTLSNDDKKNLQQESAQLLDSINKASSSTLFNGIHLLDKSGLKLDGIDDVVKNSSLDLSGNKGESTFMNVNVTKPNGSTFFLFQNQAWSRRFSVNANGNFSAIFYDNSGVIHNISSNKKFDLTKPHQIGYTFTPNQENNTYIAKLFVDGQEIGSQDIGKPLSPATQNWSFGEAWAGGDGGILYHTQGEMQSVRIYSKDLSAEEIKDLYNGNVTRDNLKLEYLFNEGEGNVTKDTSGNGNDGTISGEALWSNHVNIHAGGDASDNFQIGLSKINTETLGINNVSIDKPDTINKIDGAIEITLKELGKFASYENSLQRREDSLSSNTIEMEKSKSQITDVDFAEETAYLLKEKIISQSSLAVLTQSNALPTNFLSLLEN